MQELNTALNTINIQGARLPDQVYSGVKAPRKNGLIANCAKIEISCKKCAPYLVVWSLQPTQNALKTNHIVNKGNHIASKSEGIIELDLGDHPLWKSALAGIVKVVDGGDANTHFNALMLGKIKSKP